MSNFKLTIDKNFNAWLEFDVKNKKVNILNEESLLNLEEKIEEIKKDKTIKSLIILSKKINNFIAGADIYEISQIKNRDEGEKKLIYANNILKEIENLKIPTIAAINGSCLGGGMELALACKFRIVSDNKKTKLGQPEVNLGLIPGFGGTKRLPQTIGFKESIKMITTGKAINGKKALKIKLADYIVNESHFKDEITKLLKKGLIKKKRKRDIIDKSPIFQNLITRIAINTIRKKTKNQYPAPLEAVKLIKRTFFKSINKSLIDEKEVFLKLLKTPVSQNLIHLYMTQEHVKKKYKQNKDLKINETAVIGAGLMGSGIAWNLSYKNINVSLNDIDWKSICHGLQNINNIYKTLKRSKRWKHSEVINYMHKVNAVPNIKQIKNNDFIIEAVSEDILLKKNLFKEIEKNNEKSIIATNTSSLDIEEMSKALKKPENFIGLHFFSPVNKMPLVEIIPNSKTSKETIEQTKALSQKLNKIPIIVKNCPGFLINRILIPYVNEAILNLEDGAEINEIDTLMKKFGMPIGPLALADEVGIDVGYKVAKVLEKGYGERMKVSNLFESIIKDENLRGRKSKKGFYDYNKSKKENNDIKEILKKNRIKKEHIHRDCLDRMLLIMVNEAARCLEEKVVETPEELDLAMIMGTGFPPFRGGLCRYIDQRGIQNIVTRLELLESLYGVRFKPATFLYEKIKNELKIYN